MFNFGSFSIKKLKIGTLLDGESHKIENVLKSFKAKFSRPFYAGRAEAASPATGSLSRHNKEQADLVNEALETTQKTTKHAAE